MNIKSVVLAAAIGLAVLGGTAWAAETVASIVGADGTIHGCYAQNTGLLRVVAEGTTCNARELPIQWNQQGPPGAKGDRGARGPKGDAGPPGPGSLAKSPAKPAASTNPTGARRWRSPRRA
jgi:hypothetical protein